MCLSAHSARTLFVIHETSIGCRSFLSLNRLNSSTPICSIFTSIPHHPCTWTSLLVFGCSLCFRLLGLAVRRRSLLFLSLRILLFLSTTSPSPTPTPHQSYPTPQFPLFITLPLSPFPSPPPSPSRSLTRFVTRSIAQLSSSIRYRQASFCTL